MSTPIFYNLPPTLLAVGILTGLFVGIYSAVRATIYKYAGAFTYCRRLFAVPLLAGLLLLAGAASTAAPACYCFGSAPLL